LESGTGYRLPTEAEWEYACRAGTTTAFAFGDRLSPYDADFERRYTYNGSSLGTSLERTDRVGSYRSNDFGLYDMHGNVCEWCSDWYDAKYYKYSTELDPMGPTTGGSRVYRGGSWDTQPSLCRSAFRVSTNPEYRSNRLGFRVARIPSTEWNR
jgi:formylglycine-generating enzyme required for sulfatase activity